MDQTSRRAALTALYELPGHLLWRAAARVATEVRNLLPGGADIHAYAALVVLADHEPQSQRGLAAALGVSGTTLTAVGRTLHRDGLVERVRDPADRRCYALTRTAEGGSAMRRWSAHVDRLDRRLTSTLSGEEAARLRELLTLVIGEHPGCRTPVRLRDSCAFLVAKAHQRTHRDFLAALTPLGIEPRDFGTMRCLQAAGPLTQGAVASLLDVSPAFVVQIVDGLEAGGLVERRRGVEDRRVQLLHLTPRADGVLAEASLLSDRVLQEQLGAPGSGRSGELVRLLAALLGSAGSDRT